MDEIELTQLFVQYAETQKKLSELKAKIEAQVLDIGESRKIAGVTATYYQPTVDIDYEAAAKSVMPNDFDTLPFSTVKTTIRWKDVCEAVGADTIFLEYATEKPARVVIK